MIPNRPKYRYDPAAAARALSVARTYLDNARRLIYSYGGRTFLSGYDLYDDRYGGRGNIDCSTFILLVLAGVPYEASPYASGTAGDLATSPLCRGHGDLLDFSDLPEKYVTIAERIGRPYLDCPKGLDLYKAENLGISLETIMKELRESGAERRSTVIARRFLDSGECYSDPSFLRPGDLVFYRSAEFLRERSDEEAQIVHVGMACKDTSVMMNSSGYLQKVRAELEGLPAVSLSPVRGKREPSFFARPEYV